MSTNFLPKNVFKGTNADGSKFTMQEFDIEAIANIELFNFFGLLFFGAFFCAFLSPIVIVLAIIGFNVRFNIMAVIALIFSGLFIYDCNNGWLISLVVSFLADSSNNYQLIDTLYNIHYGIIFVSLYLILFGRVTGRFIMRNSDDSIVRFLMIAMISFGIFLVGLSVGDNITSKDNEWFVKAHQWGKYTKNPYDDVKDPEHYMWFEENRKYLDENGKLKFPE